MAYEGVQEIEGKKYHFINGVIQKGWSKLTNVSYFDEDKKRDYWSYSDLTTGELQTGLVRIDDEYFLFADSYSNDTWKGNYYSSSYPGSLCQDQFVYVDEKTYYADSDGHPVTGLKKVVRSIYNSEEIILFR
jgi:glucan-binding YG repeat protein